jgi:hypothetical protein
MRKPRKGQKCTSELDVLLRDAQPTTCEIGGEKDPRRRQERERARDIAIDELITMYLEHQKKGQLRQLDLRVRIFNERPRAPEVALRTKPMGGRPPELHRQLLIAVAVRQAIKAHGGSRGSTAKAIREVHERYGGRFSIKLEAIRDIYYKCDPKWMRAVNAEIARRTYETETDGTVTQEHSGETCRQRQPPTPSSVVKEK